MLPGRLVRCGYISVIRKHPRGIEKRLPQFDAWVGSWEDPHIRDYYQYYYNAETREHEVFMPDDPKAKAELEAVYSRHRPTLQTVFKPTQKNIQFIDDHHPSRDDISQLRLATFLKECLKEQTRSDIHRLVMWGTVASVSFVVMMLRSLVWADYEQPNLHLDPDDSYFRYNMHILRDEANMYVEKVNMVSQHSEEVMKQAKRKAIARMEDRK